MRLKCRLTSQAPLTNLSCSNTYMGSVSHKLLVLLTLIPLLSISAHAFSIHPIRSPRLLPRAMYANRFRGGSGPFLSSLIFAGRFSTLKSKLCGKVYFLKERGESDRGSECRRVDCDNLR